MQIYFENAYMREALMHMHVYSKYRPQTDSDQLSKDIEKAKYEFYMRQDWQNRLYCSGRIVFHERISPYHSVTTKMLRIFPGRDTGFEDLDEFGLRGHPGTVGERIRVIEAKEYSLAYLSRDADNSGEHEFLGGMARGYAEKHYSKGDIFYSVGPRGEGYWHTIRSLSDDEILLVVRTIKREDPRDLLRK